MLSYGSIKSPLVENEEFHHPELEDNAQEPDNNCNNPSPFPNLKQDNGLYFDVSEAIESIGWGRYQWKVICVMGMVSFADSAEIWLSTIIINEVKL